MATSTTSTTSTTSAWPGGSYSFACGGWLKMYMFGAAKALQDHGLERDARVIGCSAGALAAAGLALHVDIRTIRDIVIDEILPIAHATWLGPFNIKHFMHVVMRDVGHFERYPMVNASGQLSVVYTSLSAFASRRASTFRSADHLEACLQASCCATPIVLPFQLDGEWVMDGGVLDFQPLIDENTVTISGFYCSSADIKPSKYVPIWWAVYPPSRRNEEWLYDLGYEDCLRWMVKTGKLPADFKVPHDAYDYDGDWHTLLGRIIGYHTVESRLLDWVFFVLMVCVWKPIAFVGLYLELYMHAIVSGSKAALFGGATRLLLSTAVVIALLAGLASMRSDHRAAVLVGACVLSLLYGTMLFLSLHHQRAQAALVASTQWHTCCSCLRNIASWSLFVHLMPLVGRSVHIRRHDKLLEHSFIYRMALQFVEAYK